MPPSTSATATAGGMSLNASRGAHPTVRLDSFLRSTDVGYQHAEAQTHGDRFIRKMATYGQVRPSVSFTSEPRVTRPYKEHSAMDMSSLPANWNDPRGDPKEGTLEIPPPPAKADDSFMKLYENHSLMLPSERYKEHLHMKAAEKKWREDRESIFRYKKRMDVLERHYPQGVVGVDGPLHPGTRLYADRQAHLMGVADQKARHGEGRFEHLAMQKTANDATAQRSYGSEPNLARSQDICIQRKRVDAEAHPWRFLDTHDRLFPTFNPTWDPNRAAASRSHDVRHKTHNIISGADNGLTYNVAEKFNQEPTIRHDAPCPSATVPPFALTTGY